MSVYYVYILKCTSKSTGDSSLYTGSTQDLVQRVNQHQTGSGAKYTRGKEIELMLFETYLSRSEAMKREYEIKAFSTQKKWQLVAEFQEKMKISEQHCTEVESDGDGAE